MASILILFKDCLMIPYERQIGVKPSFLIYLYIWILQLCIQSHCVYYILYLYILFTHSWIYCLYVFIIQLHCFLIKVTGKSKTSVSSFFCIAIYCYHDKGFLLGIIIIIKIDFRFNTRKPAFFNSHMHKVTLWILYCPKKSSPLPGGTIIVCRKVHFKKLW